MQCAVKFKPGNDIVGLKKLEFSLPLGAFKCKKRVLNNNAYNAQKPII